MARRIRFSGWAASLAVLFAPAAYAAGSASATPAASSTQAPTHASAPPAPSTSSSTPTTATTTKPKPAAPAPTTKKATPPAPKKGAKDPNGKIPPRTHTPDANVRRQIAGGPTVDDVAQGAESPELEALANAERELFPPASPAFGSAWPSGLPSPLSALIDLPQVHSNGVPPDPVPSEPPVAEGAKDLSWMSKLDMPELPIRWEPRLVRYLEFFKNDPRGRSIVAVWMRRAGRYREAVRRTLRAKSIPDDLLWLAMIES
ncbi:MAG TPA: hypothetical protein VF407_15000, partial [Polyangiaceae bacterium]